MMPDRPPTDGGTIGQPISTSLPVASVFTCNKASTPPPPPLVNSPRTVCGPLGAHHDTHTALVRSGRSETFRPCGECDRSARDVSERIFFCRFRLQSSGHGAHDHIGPSCGFRDFHNSASPSLWLRKRTFTQVYDEGFSHRKSRRFTRGRALGAIARMATFCP